MLAFLQNKMLLRSSLRSCHTYNSSSSSSSREGRPTARLTNLLTQQPHVHKAARKLDLHQRVKNERLWTCYAGGASPSLEASHSDNERPGLSEDEIAARIAASRCEEAPLPLHYPTLFTALTPCEMNPKFCLHVAFIRAKRKAQPVYPCPCCAIPLKSPSNIRKHLLHCCPDIVKRLDPELWEQVKNMGEATKNSRNEERRLTLLEHADRERVQFIYTFKWRTRYNSLFLIVLFTGTLSRDPQRSSCGSRLHCQAARPCLCH